MRTIQRLAEFALLHLAVAVGVRHGALDVLAGGFVEHRTGADEALGQLQILFVPLVGSLSRV